MHPSTHAVASRQVNRLRLRSGGGRCMSIPFVREPEGPVCGARSCRQHGPPTCSRRAVLWKLRSSAQLGTGATGAAKAWRRGHAARRQASLLNVAAGGCGRKLGETTKGGPVHPDGGARAARRGEERIRRGGEWTAYGATPAGAGAVTLQLRGSPRRPAAQGGAFPSASSSLVRRAACGRSSATRLGCGHPASPSGEPCAPRRYGG